MKTHIPITIALGTVVFAAPHQKRTSVYGFDISNYQSSVDFNAAYNDGGLRFVYIKATEGLTYRDPLFSDHYEGATSAGFIRGGYHYAHGDESASDQADFFYQNGGGWTNDGITLPGMLDLKANCASVEWIQEFVDRYYVLSGRYVVLYSSPSWWESCTGNSDAFTSNNPLDIACWSSQPCAPQGSWPFYTFWHNDYGGDSDVFNGDYTQLQKLATG